MYVCCQLTCMSDNPDDMPSVRLYDGDFGVSLLMTMLSKMGTIT